MAKRIMFYCQHILGMGHLVRSTAIVEALAQDFEILFVLGGVIPKDFSVQQKVQILQLPPISSNSNLTHLQANDPDRSLDHVKALRRQILLSTFEAYKPDILVTELFPFGRKQFSFELLPLLESAHRQNRRGRTMVVCSLRDILVLRKDQPEYEERVCQLVNRFYDLILVHGDPNHQQLHETFRIASELLCPVRYTGYVVKKTSSELAASVPPQKQNAVQTVVVSNGGGQPVSGHLLLESCLRAAEILQSVRPFHFHIFAGPFMEEETFQRLQHLASGIHSATFSRYTPNLAACLKQADLSISMAGYNTIMDVLSTGVRALVSPFIGGGDLEQTIRAQKMAQKGVLNILTPEQLDPPQLAEAILTALDREPIRVAFNDQGAKNTNHILREYFASWHPTCTEELELIPTTQV